MLARHCEAQSAKYKQAMCYYFKGAAFKYHKYITHRRQCKQNHLNARRKAFNTKSSTHTETRQNYRENELIF